MSVYETFCKFPNVRALLGDSYIRKELIGGVSEPHGFDVTRDNVSRFVSVGEVVVLDGGCKGVGVGLVENLVDLRALDK